MTAYLDYAGIGIVREPARRAMHEAVDRVLGHGAGEYSRLFEARGSARRAAARLLHAEPGEIALTGNTSAGLQLVADGLAWRPGDEIVVFERDFPANVQPWRRLERSGVVLRWVPMRGGRYDLADLEPLLTSRTRLVAVSHVNFATGFRIDLGRVTALAHDRGALVSVDAVQSLGVLPVSVAETPVDFLATGGHKWLCAPPGTGIFYCRADRLDLLGDVGTGWFGRAGAARMLEEGEDHFDFDLPPRPDATRFEGAMPNLLGFVGLAAALAEVEDIGVEAIYARVAALTARVRAVAADAGHRLVSPADPADRSGITSLVPRGDSRATYDALLDADVRVSWPDGKVRIAPHYWTTDAEIDRLTEILQQSTIR